MTNPNMPKLKDPQKPSGPAKIGKFIVEVDRNLCIGAGTCVALAEKTFALDSENKAVILDNADKEIPEAIVEAAKGCPVAAVIIKDQSGKKIYPQ